VGDGSKCGGHGEQCLVREEAVGMQAGLYRLGVAFCAEWRELGHVTCAMGMYYGAGDNPGWHALATEGATSGVERVSVWL
jgi:hypothetical protein